VLGKMIVTGVREKWSPPAKRYKHWKVIPRQRPTGNIPLAEAGGAEAISIPLSTPRIPVLPT